MARTQTLALALDQMQARDHRGDPIPFTISFYTCSRTKGTGGELISVEGAVLTRNIKNLKGYQKSRKKGKRINEHANNLRNIYVPQAQQFYKVHIWLIETFNGQPVDW